MSLHAGKRWSWGSHRSGTGTKQFGVTLWGHSARLGLQLNFWSWEIQLMRERS